jgi:hypothetical protein
LTYYLVVSLGPSRDLAELTSAAAEPRAIRLSVMAARQPLELFGLGSNPGGGATKRSKDLLLFVAPA